MSAVSSTGSDVTVRRWWAWLEGSGSRLQTARPVVDHDRVETDDGNAPTQVFVRQVFARANVEERRSLDMLLVALVERAGAVEPASTDRALVIVGPEALRTQTVASPTGLTVGELTLGPVGSGLRRVSLALVRVARDSRSREVLASIEALGRLLDYRADAEGSAEVAHALVRRLEVLSSGPGVRVSVAGSLRRPGASDVGQTLHLVADTPLALDDDLELRDGKLTVTRAASSLSVPLPGDRGASAPSPRDKTTRDRRHWTGADYALVRVGTRVTRRAEARPLAQRRMEHALAEVGFGLEAPQRGGPYSLRVAAVRQTTRAERILGEALAGATTSAARRLSSALTQPGARGTLVESLVKGVGTVADYWLVAPALQRAWDDAGGDPGAHVAAALISVRLGRRLDELLALDLPADRDVTSSVVTPLVLELSDALVPIVDSQLDGGHFLYELVPAMRDRIKDRMGVVVPGVRARGNPGLPADGYVIQIDEVPVVASDVAVGDLYTVHSVAGEAVGPGADISEIHPLTGEPGRWRIEVVPGVADHGATFSPAQYLIHRLEREVLRSLRTMLGFQEVDALLELWRAEDADLVARVIDGPAAAQRLTVLLQELVSEQVPIVRWRTVFDAVVEAGGIAAHIRVLQRAVRVALRRSLPGIRTGPTALRLPDEIEAALVDREHGVVPTTESVMSAEGASALWAWLNQSVIELGGVLTVITDDPEVRRRVAVLARMERVTVHTFSAEEVDAG